MSFIETDKRHPIMWREKMINQIRSNTIYVPQSETCQQHVNRFTIVNIGTHSLEELGGVRLPGRKPVYRLTTIVFCS